MEPKTKLESEIFDAWKTLNNAEAFTGGLKEYAGRVFIPSPKNVRSIIKRISELKSRSKNASEKALLASISRRMELGEPEFFPEDILGAFFSHMIKEGINKPHLRQLADESIKALNAALEYTDRKWAPGVKILTLIRCYGLLEILDTVEKEAKDPVLTRKIQALRKLNLKYAKRFNVPGFKYDATFDQTYALLKKGSDLGREKVYAEALRDLYDYPETPRQVEAAGMRMLEAELPAFQRVVKQLAKEYRCEANAETLAKAIHKKRGLKQKQIIPFLMDARKYAEALCNKHLVRINPHYKTQVIETPPYLTGVFPSGGAFFFDFLTKKPFQIFVTTTDPKRSPHTVPAEIRNLLVHEEYGHCVHGSNSNHNYAHANPTLTESLTSLIGNAVSEGISFQREKEFMDLLEEIARMKKKLGREEREFISFCRKYGGFDSVRRQYEFYTRMWRIVRLLRIIGDARINSGKQNIVEFVEWAHKKTGLSKSLVYFQVFPGHQGLGPGYASTYAIVGERIRSIQEKARKNGVSLRELNTYACSMGFPPRRLFEKRLLAFAKSG